MEQGPPLKMRHTPHRGGGAIECIVDGTVVGEVMYELSRGAFEPARVFERSSAAGGRGPGGFLRAFFEKKMIITGIKSEVRNRGYGTALILELEEVAERLGVDRIVSEQSNINSTRLLARLGYRITPGKEGWHRAELPNSRKDQLEVSSRGGVVERKMASK